MRHVATRLLSISRPLAVALLFLTITAHAAAADEHYFDSDGVRLRYTIDGEGDPVVLIHGYTANGALNWRASGVIRMLADDYQVITLDCRGHGGSDKPETVDAYGVTMVEDVVRLLDHLEIDQAHIAGYSMGGMITLKFASMHPERMRSAAVCGMGWISAAAAEARPQRERSGSSGSAALAACANGFRNLALTRAALLEIDVPLTVIVGANDGLLERTVEPLRQARTDIPVVIVPDANHVNCAFKPEFRQALATFIDQQNESP